VEKSQYGAVTHQTGEIPFNIRMMGQPSSLMDQIEMLNNAQMTPKGHYTENTTENNIISRFENYGNNTPKGENKKLENQKKENQNQFSSSSPRNHTGNKGSTNTMDMKLQDMGSSQVAHSKKVSTNKTNFEEKTPSHVGVVDKKVPPIKLHQPSQLSPASKSSMPNVSTNASTVDGTQNSILGSESYSYYPAYGGNYSKKNESPTEMTHQITDFRPNMESNLGRNNQKGENPNQGNQQSKINEFGVMDMKTKKEMYLRGDNVLVEALDKTGEKYHHRGTLSSPSDPYRANNAVFGETGRNQITEPSKIPANSYSFPQKIMGSLQDSEKNILCKINMIDVSATMNNGDNSSNVSSGRNTKRLKLVKKSIKGKEDITAPKGSYSGNIPYDS
jgi:hypothetical protein